MNDDRCPVCLGTGVRIDSSAVLGGGWISANCQRCGTFRFHEDSDYPLTNEGNSRDPVAAWAVRQSAAC